MIIIELSVYVGLEQNGEIRLNGRILDPAGELAGKSQGY